MRRRTFREELGTRPLLSSSWKSCFLATFSTELIWPRIYGGLFWLEIPIFCGKSVKAYRLSTRKRVCIYTLRTNYSYVKGYAFLPCVRTIDTLRGMHFYPAYSLLTRKTVCISTLRTNYWHIKGMHFYSAYSLLTCKTVCISTLHTDYWHVKGYVFLSCVKLLIGKGLCISTLRTDYWHVNGYAFLYCLYWSWIAVCVLVVHCYLYIGHELLCVCSGTAVYVGRELLCVYSYYCVYIGW